MLNTDTWPMWAVLVVVLAREFKPQIVAMLPKGIRDAFEHWTSRRIDRQEHEQLRESWREEQWVEQIREKDDWILTTLTGEIHSLTESNATLVERVAENTAGLARNNELISMLNGSITKLVDLLQEQKGKPWSLR